MGRRRRHGGRLSWQLKTAHLFVRLFLSISQRLLSQLESVATLQQRGQRRPLPHSQGPAPLQPAILRAPGAPLPPWQGAASAGGRPQPGLWPAALLRSGRGRASVGGALPGQRRAAPAPRPALARPRRQQQGTARPPRRAELPGAPKRSLDSAPRSASPLPLPRQRGSTAGPSVAEQSTAAEAGLLGSIGHHRWAIFHPARAPGQGCGRRRCAPLRAAACHRMPPPARQCAGRPPAQTLARDFVHRSWFAECLIITACCQQGLRRGPAP